MKLNNKFYYDQGAKAWNAEAFRWLKDGCTWTESASQANRLVGKSRQDLIKVGKTQFEDKERF